MSKRVNKNNLLNKILVCGASLVMFGAIGASINTTVNAKSIHHIHTHRTYRHIRHHISNRGYHHSNKRRNHKRYNNGIRYNKRYYRYMAKLHRHIPNFLPNHKNNNKSYHQVITTINYIDNQIAKGDNFNNKRLEHKMILADNDVIKNAHTYSQSQLYNLFDNYSFNLNDKANNAVKNNLLVNKRNSKKYNGKNLSYNQLIPTFNYIYEQLDKGAGLNDKGLISRMDLINNTIIKNAHTYNRKQLYTLKNLNYGNGLSNQAYKAINNGIKDDYNRTFKTAWNNRGNNSFADQIAQDEYNYINQVREEDGLKPLPINGYMQEVANMRSKQYTQDMEAHESNTMENDQLNGINKPADDLAHGYDYHDTEDDDASQLHISDDNGTAENAGITNKGYNLSQGDRFGDKFHTETNDTPQEIAYNDVNDMVNYDRFTKNGHRNTILDKKATGIGVSSYYHSNGVQDGTATDYAPSYGGTIQDYSYGNDPTDI